MINYIQDKFALSKQGAKDLLKASFACCGTNIAIMLSVGILYKFLVDIVMPIMNGNRPEVSPISYIVLGAIVLTLIYIGNYVQYNATFLASYAESSIKRITLAEKLRKLPLSFFGNKDLSDLTTTIMNDVAGLEGAFSHFIPQLFGALVSTVLVSIGMLCMNLKMGLSLIWVVPVSFILTIGTKNIQKRSGKRTKNDALNYADGIQECIENIKDIKSNNQTQKHIKIMEGKLRAFEKSSIKSELTVGVLVTAAQMILRVGISTTMVVGVSMLLSKEIDILMFLAFIMAATRIFDPLAGGLQNLACIYNAFLMIDRMKEIENYKIQEGETSPSYNGHDIVFKDVKFSYNTGENVLHRVSFTAKQGEVTALVGPSGGGKSTAAKLSSRFWDIDSGMITLGGVDISKIEPEELLRNYSIVFQDVVLFNNTVMENIRIGKMDATNQELYDAAKAARCHEFICKMPQGYDTIIGENGSALSGGERQRISIARALLKDAPVILLDEATASLDVENETLVQDAISTLIKNKTVIIIAHRMRTVVGADKIVVLKHGKVAEMGNHSELIRKEGIYANMVNLQNKSLNWTLKNKIEHDAHVKVE